MADLLPGAGSLAKLRRYIIASAGPISSAGAQFFLSLSLLRLLPASAFGSFSFLLVATNFSWGLWSALFCAPLPILLNEGGTEARDAVSNCLFSTNLIVATLAGMAFGCISLALDVPPIASVLLAGYASVALLRWFARAYAYAIGAPLRTMLSDLTYCGVLLAGIGSMLATHSGSLVTAYGSLFVSVLAGLAPFGLNYLSAQFGRFRASSVLGYAAIWKRFAGWSLLGVLTTEATANCHAYIVTAFMGPTAFAPIAASALTTRPTSVAMNALTEFERAQMARSIAERRVEDTMESVQYFRMALAVAWIATAILVVLLTIYYPHAIFPKKYDLHFLQIGAALWTLVAAVRMMRTPESAMLQAGGAFRPLALASVISSGVSVVAVVAALLAGGTLYSISGILVGELMYAMWIWRQAHRWYRSEIVQIGGLAAV